MKIVLAILGASVVLISCSAKDSPDPSQSAPPVENVTKSYPSINDVVTASFSSSILRDYSHEGSKLRIEVQDSRTVPDYFETGDKVNKILAIEPVRMFYKIPSLTEVEIVIDIRMGRYQLDVTKSQAESFYGIDIDGMREYFDTGQLMPGDKWRTQFIQRFDEPNTRARFVQQFLVR